MISDSTKARCKKKSCENNYRLLHFTMIFNFSIPRKEVDSLINEIIEVYDLDGPVMPPETGRRSKKKMVEESKENMLESYYQQMGPKQDSTATVNSNKRFNVH